MTAWLTGWHNKNSSNMLYEPYADIWTTTKDWGVISKKTEEIFSNESVVVKLQTTDISIQGQPPYFSTSNYKLLDNYRLLDYDSIFLLYRANTLEQLSSLLVAHETKSYFHTEKPRAEDYIVTFDLVKHHFLFNLILDDFCKLSLVKRYLTDNDKKFTLLEYTDVVDYLNEHCPNVDIPYVKTDFEYSKMITNYDFFKETVQHYFRSFSSEI
jgi:hypothetical protein